ncbi:hypothetical protein CHS0354_033881 [Potamilus streckersoni]|uniref:Uncharacterized protein n=1 Tax=Potamilus streckersoni TaxID=2493646 RepID=A0AAE0RWQ5_9BIVA|nr:hypothetical protein CHS0354_033881 [Potamilus streckersoni]
MLVITIEDVLMLTVPRSPNTIPHYCSPEWREGLEKHFPVEASSFLSSLNLGVVSLKAKGIEVYKTVRDEFVLRNLSLRLEEGYAVFEADVIPSQFHNETEGDYTWIGYYDSEDWKLILNDTTPFNVTGMPIQLCTPSTTRRSSVGEAGRALNLEWLILGIFIGTMVLIE